MKKLLKKLFYHDGNGWWNLPKNMSGKPNPPYEGPIGGPWLIKMINLMTYGGKSHAGPRFYIIVGIFLAIITALEVWAFELESELAILYIPILLILALIKFVAVVAFYMHLRFDNRFFSYVFASGMIVGTVVFSLLLFISEAAYMKR